MARAFITGSADGLGRAAAQMLLDTWHGVVVHARNQDQLAAVRGTWTRGAAAVTGDLFDLGETREIADQVNRLGRMDAPLTSSRSSLPTTWHRVSRLRRPVRRRGRSAPRRLLGAAARQALFVAAETTFFSSRPPAPTTADADADAE
jgi:NAD(P)-dependent dehydrogenase (short-subunit alcohol dehydrogenase family)